MVQDFLCTPGSEITIPEARQTMTKVFGYYADAAEKLYDGAIPLSLPRFSELSQGQQTVLVSRMYQQGTGFIAKERYQPFWKAATTGEWGKVKDILDDYPGEQYLKDRAKKESLWLDPR
jgi:hypothetical protein